MRHGQIIATLACAALLIGLAGAATAADYPRAGYPGAPNGGAAPFAGNWRMSYPQGVGVVVAEVLIDCDDPMVIEAVDASHIRYRSPAMEAPIVAELMAFEDRTTWMPDAYDTAIAVWLTPDAFHLHRTELGKANWDDPRLLVRCPA